MSKTSMIKKDFFIQAKRYPLNLIFLFLNLIIVIWLQCNIWVQ